MTEIVKNKFIINIPSYGDITIYGYSKSAYRTGYVVMPFGIHLDAGLPSPFNAKMVLLSHGHYDHIASLFSILIEANDCKVMLSKHLTSTISEMLTSTQKLNRFTRPNNNTIKFDWNPISIQDNKDYMFSKNIMIETFKLDHNVESFGFGIYQIRNKLKEEYIGVPGREIAELKKTTEITYTIRNGIVLFISDTSKKPLDKLPFSDYKCVIIECTFFDEEHYEEAQERTHIHWFDLKHYVKKNNNTTFLLGHLSKRYNNEKIQEIISSIEYDNVKIFK